MRTREEIEKSWRGEELSGKANVTGKYFYRPTGSPIEGLILETLLDIKELLQNQENRENQSLQAKIITQCACGTSIKCHKHTN